MLIFSKNCFLFELAANEETEIKGVEKQTGEENIYT
jgi:hypothetical protein